MSIVFQNPDRIFRLETHNTSYGMQIDSRGQLLHLYYGRRIG